MLGLAWSVFTDQEREAESKSIDRNHWRIKRVLGMQLTQIGGGHIFCMPRSIKLSSRYFFHHIICSEVPSLYLSKVSSSIVKTGYFKNMIITTQKFKVLALAHSKEQQSRLWKSYWLLPSGNFNIIIFLLLVSLSKGQGLSPRTAVGKIVQTVLGCICAASPLFFMWD